MLYTIYLKVYLTKCIFVLCIFKVEAEDIVTLSEKYNILSVPTILFFKVQCIFILYSILVFHFVTSQSLFNIIDNRITLLQNP